METRFRVRAQLWTRGWPIREFAERTGYSANHISRMLRGVRPLSRRFLIACEYALKLEEGALSA